MPSVMTRLRKAKWEKKTCGCVKTELGSPLQQVIIRCERHRGKPSKSGRALCYWADGQVRREAERKRDLRGTQQVYFAQLGDLIKIGLSFNPERRARGLNATLLATFLGDFEHEKKMHRKFADLHERGEWYRAEEPLLSWIKGLLL